MLNLSMASSSDNDVMIEIDDDNDSINPSQWVSQFSTTTINTNSESKKSFVHKHSKRDGDSFICQVDRNDGSKCLKLLAAKKGNTSNTIRHLKDIHRLYDPKSIKKLLPLLKKLFFGPPRPPKKKKPFREAYVLMVAKQYLCFQMIDNQVVQDCFIAFAEENGVDFSVTAKPEFVSSKTVAADVTKLAELYIEKVIYI
jgi:hypothetical protein